MASGVFEETLTNSAKKPAFTTNTTANRSAKPTTVPNITTVNNTIRSVFTTNTFLNRTAKPTNTPKVTSSRKITTSSPAAGSKKSTVANVSAQSNNKKKSPTQTSKQSYNNDRVNNAVSALAAKNAGIKTDSRGVPIINNGYDANRYLKEYDKIKKNEISIKAATAAGVRTNSYGEPIINGASDAKAYMEAYSSISAKLAYKNDDRYKQLTERVNSWDNIESYKKDFVMEVFPVAIEYEHKTGIPAEIIFGQICTESAYGQNTITDKYTGQNANNYFGYKGKGPAGTVVCDTHEYVNGHLISIEDNFKAYNSLDESIADYTDLLLNEYEKYTTTGTPEDWAKALEEGHYATALNYGDSILGVAETWCVYE